MAVAVDAKIALPDFMRYEKRVRTKSPVYLLTPQKGEFDPNDPEQQQIFNRAIVEVLHEFDDYKPRPPALLKVHIGERKCRTRMNPVYSQATIDYLKQKGVSDYFFGDSTVVYSGPRGHRENGPEANSYLELAKEHGWTTESAPFIVLDRPKTSVPGYIEFQENEVVHEVDVGGRFKRFALSAGVPPSGSIIHHVHLTLHQFSHFALCLKGLSMGLAGRSGKLVMHQSYHPVIDSEKCSHCDFCVDTCPEGAWISQEDAEPILDPSLCIGCGECMANCPLDCIEMKDVEITNWLKGENTLPYRMAHYLMGLMAGRWQDIMNIAHLYNITKLCDCVDKKQKPICDNIGMMVGRNPFAVDYAARQVLEEHLSTNDGKSIKSIYSTDTSYEVFKYAHQQFGVITEPNIIPIKV